MNDAPDAEPKHVPGQDLGVAGDLGEALRHGIKKRIGQRVFPKAGMRDCHVRDENVAPPNGGVEGTREGMAGDPEALGR